LSLGFLSWELRHLPYLLVLKNGYNTGKCTHFAPLERQTVERLKGGRTVMSQKIHNRERYKRLKAKRQLQNLPSFWIPFRSFGLRKDLKQARNWQFQDKNRFEHLLYLKQKDNKSLHGGICVFSSSFYHPLWRRAAKRICQLHLLGRTDKADNLDPQPKKCGIMWYIY
jgi:hypothetical protein